MTDHGRLFFEIVNIFFHTPPGQIKALITYSQSDRNLFKAFFSASWIFNEEGSIKFSSINYLHTRKVRSIPQMNESQQEVRNIQRELKISNNLVFFFLKSLRKTNKTKFKKLRKYFLWVDQLRAKRWVAETCWSFLKRFKGIMKVCLLFVLVICVQSSKLEFQVFVLFSLKFIIVLQRCLNFDDTWK